MHEKTWVISTRSSYPLPQFLKIHFKKKEPNLLSVFPDFYSLVNSLTSILNLISPWQIILIPFVFCVDMVLQGMIPIFGAVSSGWLDPRLQHLSFGVKRPSSFLLSWSSSPCLKSSTHSSDLIDTFTGVRVAFPEGKHFCLIVRRNIPHPPLRPCRWLGWYSPRCGHIWAKRQLCLG